MIETLRLVSGASEEHEKHARSERKMSEAYAKRERTRNECMMHDAMHALGGYVYET